MKHILSSNMKNDFLFDSKYYKVFRRDKNISMYIDNVEDNTRKIHIQKALSLNKIKHINIFYHLFLKLE